MGAGKDQRNEVRAWSYGGALLERYRYSAGPTGGPPLAHFHERYQFGFSPDSPGEYRYRGDRHPVPVGALSVVHPGEVHVTRDPVSLPAPASYLTLYADRGLLRAAAEEVSGREGQWSEGGEPFFPGVTVRDREVAGRFALLCAALKGPSSRLEKDSLQSSFLAELVARHAEGARSPGRTGKERRAVGLAREYLEDNLAKNVSLADLARLAGLSPFYLLRVFAEEVGAPPHAYQIAARVYRAKGLLIEGRSLSEVASETGFYDQGHLIRHFRRHVGVTPGAYAKNSNQTNAPESQ